MYAHSQLSRENGTACQISTYETDSAYECIVILTNLEPIEKLNTREREREKQAHRDGVKQPWEGPEVFQM